jgi:uncharacterized protein YfaP (DUF2135 family)
MSKDAKRQTLKDALIAARRAAWASRRFIGLSAPRRGWLSGQWDAPVESSIRNAAVELRLAWQRYGAAVRGEHILQIMKHRDQLWARERENRRAA